MNLTKSQTAILHHTLGLRPGQRTASRNHFLASAGHADAKDLEELVFMGAMARGRAPAFCPEDSILYQVTEAGKLLAQELLPPEPVLTRYQTFCRTDSGNSFGEYLVRELPKFERRSGYKMGPHGRHVWVEEHRMFRFSVHHPWTRDIEGEWCTTRLLAKASYKRALAKHLGRKVEQRYQEQV